jgi:alpha-glucosidase
MTSEVRDASTETFWWKGALIYQVYLRSFVDSDEDGIGDIRGFVSRLDYIRDLGVDAIWITPFYPSPMKDFGYDVSDYRAIDPVFGDMADFEAMVAETHARGLKLILDHVWSHTSDVHPWFLASSDPSHPEHEKYKDWYVWSKGKGEGVPSNNWRSVFAGSAWEWHPKRGMYFLHNFLKEQPDLNWHNPEVRAAIYEIARFWLDKGVDGFRLDVCNFYAHDPDLKDNPSRSEIEAAVPSFDDHHNIHNINREENLGYLAELQDIFDAYPGTLSLGEMAAVTVDTVADYVVPGDRLDAAYSSFLIYAKYPEASEIEDLLTQNFGKLMDKAICWVTGTHDFHRVASRWKADDPARQQDMVIQTMAFLLSMPGLASIYQGEELGLEQAPIGFDQMRDPQGINFGAVEKSRDGCRVPMPWSADGPSLGFNESGESWLPVPDAYRAVAVDMQERDEFSCLNVTRKLVKLRQSTPAWRYGRSIRIDRYGTIIRFERGFEDRKTIFLYNFSGEKQSCAGDVWTNVEETLHSQGFSADENGTCLEPYGFAIGIAAK